jgi:hypothetical protein
MERAIAEGLPEMAFVHVKIPEDCANDLVDAELAIRPAGTRGASLEAAFSLASSVTSTLATVTINRATLREFIRSLLRGPHFTDQNESTLTVNFSAGGRSISFSETCDEPGRTRAEIRILSTAREFGIFVEYGEDE